MNDQLDERRKTTQPSLGRGQVIATILAAAVVLASFLCVLAFAQSPATAPPSPNRASAPPPASSPATPAAPAANADVEAEDAEADTDGSARDASESKEESVEEPEKPGTQFLHREDYTVKPDRTIEGDRYIVSSDTNVEGTIDGDLFTITEETMLTGQITGDLNVLSKNVTINGSVRKDARVVGSRLMMRGTITGDLLAFCGDIRIVGGHVGGRTVAFAPKVTLDGEFEEQVNAGGGEITFNGHAHDDVRIRADVLKFGDQARIDGDLTYESRQELDILKGDNARNIVTGKVIFVPKKGEANKSSGATHYIWIIWTFVASFLIGCCVILPTRRLMQTILETLRRDTLKSLAFGILGHILVPTAGLVLIFACLGLGLVTMAASHGRIPALAFAFLPPGFLILAVWCVLFYLAKIVVAAALGDTILRRLGRDPSPYLALLVGMVPVWILIQIPILGAFLYFIVVPIFGIGAILIGVRAHMARVSSPGLTSTAAAAS